MRPGALTRRWSTPRSCRGAGPSRGRARRSSRRPWPSTPCSRTRRTGPSRTRGRPATPSLALRSPRRRRIRRRPREIRGCARRSHLLPAHCLRRRLQRQQQRNRRATCLRRRRRGLLLLRAGRPGPPSATSPDQPSPQPAAREPPPRAPWAPSRPKPAGRAGRPPWRPPPVAPPAPYSSSRLRRRRRWRRRWRRRRRRGLLPRLSLLGLLLLASASPALREARPASACGGRICRRSSRRCRSIDPRCATSSRRSRRRRTRSGPARSAGRAPPAPCAGRRCLVTRRATAASTRAATRSSNAERPGSSATARRPWPP
mmetsp:Transcript_4595/g.12821  ORF Transcript_4595/g.12821 Transcript_4595/m.12821 type:complete len:315 (+) Transcript_4595:367-1311(+)